MKISFYEMRDKAYDEDMMLSLSDRAFKKLLKTRLRRTLIMSDLYVNTTQKVPYRLVPRKPEKCSKQAKINFGGKNKC